MTTSRCWTCGLTRSSREIDLLVNRGYITGIISHLEIRCMEYMCYRQIPENRYVERKDLRIQKDT